MFFISIIFVFSQKDSNITLDKISKDFSEGGCSLNFNWKAIKQNVIAAEQVKIASYFLPKMIVDVNVVVYLSLRKKTSP